MPGTPPGLLIVQDDPTFAEKTATIAKDCGYSPLGIHNSNKFAQSYREALPAVVFMELFMPDIDGIEMVNWLIEEESQSPVIMTAKKTPDLAAPAVLIAEAAGLFSVSILAHPMVETDIRAALENALPTP